LPKNDIGFAWHRQEPSQIAGRVVDCRCSHESTEAQAAVMRQSLQGGVFLIVGAELPNVNRCRFGGSFRSGIRSSIISGIAALSIRDAEQLMTTGSYSVEQNQGFP
jgi:hypothetical protein